MARAYRGPQPTGSHPLDDLDTDQPWHDEAHEADRAQDHALARLITAERYGAGQPDGEHLSPAALLRGERHRPGPLPAPASRDPVVRSARRAVLDNDLDRARRRRILTDDLPGEPPPHSGRQSA